MGQLEPQIDILLPFWGDPDHLWATVDSIRAQTATAWRLTVVDDCYPDPAVAAAFADESDVRMRYLRNPVNLGVAANFEKCRTLAQAPLMMFMGCDDLLGPNYVQTVIERHREYPEAAIFETGVSVIDERGHPVLPLGDRVKKLLTPKLSGPAVLSGEKLAVSLLRGDWLYWPSLTFRTDVLARYAFSTQYEIVLDLALLIELVADGHQLVVDPAPHFAYRRHTASASSASLLDGSRFADDRDYFRFAAHTMQDRGWPRAARAAKRRWISRLHAASLLPTALRARNARALRTICRHTLGR